MAAIRGALYFIFLAPPPPPLTILDPMLRLFWDITLPTFCFVLILLIHKWHLDLMQDRHANMPNATLGIIKHLE